MILKPAPPILKPAEARRVRKPDGSLLDPAGEALELTSYFARLLADGDLVEVEPPKEPKGSKPA